MSIIYYILSISLFFTDLIFGEQVQVSKLLDSLLKNYDNHLRPNYGGNPISIEVNIMIRSMGPISESRMTYSMDCYFRQSWIDKRLAFNANKYVNETLAININTMNKLWRPDTYFYNGKHSYLHTITSPNKFVRLHRDGRILYSSRLTIIAACSMNLRNFPMDIQQCPLKLGSFGYTNRDIIYRWNSEKQIAIADDMKLSQFDLIATPTSNWTDYAIIRKQKFQSTEEDLFTCFLQLTICTFLYPEYSMLEVHFHLQRHMGNFLIQIYGPCCLLVVLSWVSFWLNREATADRVSLGITTFLTITFLGLESRADLPQVPYFTALDSFLVISFAFIFASIVQFAFVHYNTKIGSGELYFMSDLQMDDNKKQEEWNRLSNKSHFVHFLQEMNDKQKQKNYHNSCKSIRINHNNNNNNGINQFRAQLSLKRQRRCIQQLNSVSEIDKISRIVFPVLFLIINLIYWCFYLN